MRLRPLGSHQDRRITKFFPSLGLLLLIGWLAIRLGGGYENLTPYQSGDWRDFMLMSKYPPSLVFLMWNLGGIAIAIAGHNYLERKPRFKRFWSVIALWVDPPVLLRCAPASVQVALPDPCLEKQLGKGLPGLVGGSGGDGPSLCRLSFSEEKIPAQRAPACLRSRTPMTWLGMHRRRGSLPRA